MGLTFKNAAALETRTGEVYVAKVAGEHRPLLAITPVGTPWLAAALPAPLQDMFTIHAMDLPGTGRSTLRGGRPSVQNMVEAIEDVAATLDDRPILFGHSMNGTLALAAATLTACAGVIAVTPPPCLPPDPSHSANYWESQADEERRQRGQELVTAYEATTDAAERDSLRERFDRLRRWYDINFDPTELDDLATIDLDWVAAVFESGRTVDWTTTIGDVGCPVLLGLGAYDFVAPPTSWTNANTPRDWTVHLFERSGHTPFLEEAEDFVRVVAKWETNVDA